MIQPSELEALEILYKSGRIAPNVEWNQAVTPAADYIVQLADRIKAERKPVKREEADAE